MEKRYETIHKRKKLGIGFGNSGERKMKVQTPAIDALIASIKQKKKK